MTARAPTAHSDRDRRPFMWLRNALARTPQMTPSPPSPFSPLLPLPDPFGRAALSPIPKSIRLVGGQVVATQAEHAPRRVSDGWLWLGVGAAAGERRPGRHEQKERGGGERGCTVWID